MDLVTLLRKNFDMDNANVLTNFEATEKYGNTTFSPQITLDSAIVVKKVTAISKILELANQHGFHLFPISTGNNWGYGSIQNTELKQPKVVLDLGSLTNIYPTNKELGLITVEPGVTQQQLYEYLEKNKWEFMTPVTGAGPTCSILSNALERGYGITPRTDHFMAVNALKAYFPHPDLCNTIFSSAVSELDQSKSDFIDKTFKWGLGPYIDGLLTQSNLGIVTEVTIRLAPKPRHFCAFYVQIPDASKFLSSIAFIRNFLKDYEGIVGSINLMDKNRLISMSAPNPNDLSSNTTMTPSQIDDLTKTYKLPEWMIVGSLYGPKEIVKLSKKDLKKRASKLGKIYFSDSYIMKTAKRIVNLPLPNIKFLNTLKNQIHSLGEGMEIMLGKPNQIALPLAYWRNPRVTPDKKTSLQPDKDTCGLLWYAPLIPMEPNKILDFVNFIRNTTPKYGIEPLITFTNLKHDCIDATVPIIFDLLNPEAVSQAHECLDILISEGRKFGFVPYRLDINQQTKLDKNKTFWQVTTKLKNSLDPNHIISPNRYNP